MPSVHLQACTFSHDAATPVLADVWLDLADEWVGIVGANGSGKSTLLRVLTGQLSSSSGRMSVVADRPPVLCPQEVGDLDDAVRRFSLDWDGTSASLRSRLDLDVGRLDRWSTLSPGERKRWQVGAALAADPDVLALDEPTNHLDADARAMLVDVLGRFRGLGLVVSHDRDLLDGLTTSTVRVAHAGVDAYAGSYTRARQRWRAEEADIRRRHDRARREQRRLRRALGEVRHDRQGAERAGRAARRDHPDQPDVREAGRKFAQQKAERKLGNRVHQLRTRVERAGEVVDAIEVGRARGGDVHLPAEGADQRRWVATLSGDVGHAGGTVLDDVDVAVARGEHVHVAGPNGAGKSTLLRALAAAAPGKLEWLAQETTAATARQILADVRALDPQRRGRVLGIVANLGVAPDRVLVTDRPSPGQGRKLALARLLLDPADLVVLDEPTNHLDLPSIEALEVAVAEYPGAIVVATHDHPFARATTTTCWQVAARRVVVTAADRPDR